MRKTPLLLSATAMATLVFLALPILVVVPMSFSASSTLSFPPAGLSLRWYRSFFASEDWIGALGTSVVLAAVSSTGGLVLGTLAAYGLRRRSVLFAGAVESNFMAPMVLPTIITAVALYIAYARAGILGTFAGLVAAHIMLGVPYFILVMGVAIKSFDLRLEQVAWTMGASWGLTMRKVVVPLLAPNIAAAWIFAFVCSFDEVVVTSFIAGAYDTIPKRMFNELTLEISPTITAVATLLIAFTGFSLGCAAFILKRTAATSRVKT